MGMTAAGTDDSSTPPTGEASTAWRYGPPVVLWLLAMAAVRATAWAAGFSPFDRQVLARWDSSHYMTIATTGYRLYRSDGSEGWPAGSWIGNAGWMPGYPLLMRAGLALGVPVDIGGTVISAVFCLATLVALWQLFLRMHARPMPALLCAAAFFPGFVYCFAVFPVSMATFFAVVALGALSRRNWWIAGAAGAAMSFSYATGFLTSVVALIWLLLGEQQMARRERVKGVLIAGGLPWLGIVATCVVDQIQVGRWNAFFLVQEKYGHGLFNPVTTLLFHVRIIQEPDVLWFGAGFCLALVAVLVIVAVATGVRQWRSVPPVERLLLIFLGVFWFAPLLTGPGVSPWRTTALLLPASGLAVRLPPPVRWALAGVFLLSGTAITVLFFRGQVI